MSRGILGVDNDIHAAGSGQGVQNSNGWLDPANPLNIPQSENYINGIQPVGQINFPGEISGAKANPASDSNIYTNYWPGISYNNQGALRDVPNISDLGKFKSLEDAQHYLTTIKISSVLSNMTVNPLIEIIKMLNGTKEFGIHPFKELGDFCKKNNLDIGILDSNNNVVVYGSSEGNVYGLSPGQNPVLIGPDTFTPLFVDALGEASSKYNPGSKSDILKFIDKNSMIQLANGMRGTPTPLVGYFGFGLDQDGQINFRPQEKYSGVTVDLPSFYRIVAAQKTNRVDW